MTETLPHKLDINAAAETLKNVALKTPLQFHKKLSEKFKAEIYIKREDVQVVRYGKVRRSKLYYLRDRVGKAAKVKEQIRK